MEFGATVCLKRVNVEIGTGASTQETCSNSSPVFNSSVVLLFSMVLQTQYHMGFHVPVYGLPIAEVGYFHHNRKPDPWEAVVVLWTAPPPFLASPFNYFSYFFFWLVFAKQMLHA